MNYSLSTWTDINERKKSELELKKSSLIINSASDSVITADVSGNIILWNRGAENIYGYKKEEIIGKSIGILYKKEDLHDLEKIISKLLSGNSKLHEKGRELTQVEFQKENGP